MKEKNRSRAVTSGYNVPARESTIRGARGSLAAIVVGMLLVFVLIVLYLRAFTPSGPKGPPETALEAARKQAQNFEDEQRKRLEALQHAAE